MTAAAVLAQPDVAPAIDDQALLKVLHTALSQPWKSEVLNVIGVVLRDAFAAVGFGFKECFNYNPLLHERQVACVWILELNDNEGLAAAAADVAGTDEEPREVANMAVRVKIVVREVDAPLPVGGLEKQLLCSLTMMVPSFEVPADPVLREAWIERELGGDRKSVV